MALELFSLRQRRTLVPDRYYDAGDLVLPMGNVEDALEVIESAATDAVSYTHLDVYKRQAICQIICCPFLALMPTSK